MDVRSNLWISLLVFGLVCDGFIEATMPTRGSFEKTRGNSDSSLLSNILHRRKRTVAGETITVVGQRINSGITDPVLIRQFLENLEIGSNRGWQGMGGGGGTTDREEDKDSDCVMKDFIKALEGMETEAYVPKDKNGNVLGHSGVTVGGGVDLGSKSRSFFRGIGVCSPLIDRLEPYFGRQGSAADTYLQQNPLTLTDSEASYLTDLVMQHNVQSVESRYNAAIGSGMSQFNQLTDAQRTVISSVLFQYGSTRRVPTFWRHVTNQDWDAAVAELRDFGDRYSTRRNKEADLLENDDGSKGDCDSDSGSRRKRSLPCPTRPLPPPVDSDLPGLRWCSPWPRCQRYARIP